MTHALEPDLICLLGDYVVRERRNVHGVAPGNGPPRSGG